MKHPASPQLLQNRYFLILVFNTYVCTLQKAICLGEFPDIMKSIMCVHQYDTRAQPPVLWDSIVDEGLSILDLEVVKAINKAADLASSPIVAKGVVEK